MSLPLDGIRILELGEIIAGTYGGQVMSDLGAEVIKIEPPSGDRGRDPSVAPYRGESGLFLTLNRNKKSVVLDLDRPAGREVFYELVRVADVVIDNFPPGALEQLRIDYGVLSGINSRIVQCSINGFVAPAGDAFAGFDVMMQASTGHMAITGEPDGPPVKVGVPIADLAGGVFACQGILAALFDRQRSGKGRRVELGVFDAALNLQSYIATMWLSNGELPRRPGSAHEYTVPWQAFRAKDGYLVVATREDSFWRRLCEALNKPSLANDPRYATGAQRVKNRAELIPLLEACFGERTVVEWLALLRSAEVPCGPVNHLDAAFSEPPVVERDMIVEYDHPQVGRVRLPGNPIKIAGAPLTPSRPAPLLGEHTEQVLSEVLGFSAERIVALRAQRAIAP